MDSGESDASVRLTRPFLSNVGSFELFQMSFRMSGWSTTVVDLDDDSYFGMNFDE